MDAFDVTEIPPATDSTPPSCSDADSSSSAWLKTPLTGFGELLDSIDVDEVFFSKTDLREEFLSILGLEFLVDYCPRLLRLDKSVFQAFVHVAKAREAISRSEPSFRWKEPKAGLRRINDALMAAPYGSRIFADILLFRATLSRDRGDVGSARADVRFLETACDAGVAGHGTENLGDLVAKLGKLKSDLRKSPSSREMTEIVLRGNVSSINNNDKGETINNDNSPPSKDGGREKNDQADDVSELQIKLTSMNLIQGEASAPQDARNSKDLKVIFAEGRPSKTLMEANQNQISDCLRLEHCQTKGMRYVATEDVRPGEMLLTEKPICGVLYPDNWSIRCNFCHKVVWHGIPCPNCPHALFCNESCRQRAFSYHRFECPIMLNLRELFTYISVPVAFRLVTCTKVEDILAQEGTAFSRAHPDQVEANDNSTKSSQDWKSTFNFLNHRQSTNPQVALRSAKVAVYLVKLLESVGYFNDEAVGTIQADLDRRAKGVVGELIYNWLLSFPSNSFTTSEIRVKKDKEEGMKVWAPAVGEAVFSAASKFNHSCYPNASHYFVDCGRRIVVTAHRPIRAGEEVTISYGSYAFCDQEEDRRAWLLERYHFECGCVACAEHWGVRGRNVDVPLTTASFTDFASAPASASPTAAPTPPTSTTDVHEVSKKMTADELLAARRNQKLVQEHSRTASFSPFEGHACDVCGPYPDKAATRKIRHPRDIAEARTAAAAWAALLDGRYAAAVASTPKDSARWLKLRQPPVCMFQAQFSLVTCCLLGSLFDGAVAPPGEDNKGVDDDDQRDTKTPAATATTDVANSGEVGSANE